jgi:hypothetical protein
MTRATRPILRGVVSTGFERVLGGLHVEFHATRLRPSSYEELELGMEILVAAGDDDRPRVAPIGFGAGCSQGREEVPSRTRVSQTNDFRHA